MPENVTCYKKSPKTRKKAEDPLTQFAHRYQAFFNSTYDAIVVFTPHGEIVDANPRLLEISGFTYSSLISKSISTLFDETSVPDIQLRIQILIEEQHRKYPLECVLVPKSGKNRQVEMNLTMLRDQYGYAITFFGVVRDVTHQKEIESHLMQRATELEKVLDAVPHILLVLDERKRIRKINRSGLIDLKKMDEHIVGSKIGEALGCSVLNNPSNKCGFAEDCHKCALREYILRSMKAGERINNTEIVLSTGPSGQSVYYNTNLVPMIIREQRLAVISLEDITQRKLSEIRSEQLHQSIARANLELKKTLEDLGRSQSQLLEAQKLEQVGLLASGLAHNLKSPLGGIKGYAQLLKMDYSQCHELDIIINEVEVMESIINNLMFKSRKEDSNKEEDIDLNHLLRTELIFLEANLFYKHNVEKEIDFAADLPVVKGIYSHFSQAIMNIVQNALDAMHSSPVKKLTVRTEWDDRYITILVADTGCGIPGEHQSDVFRMFFTTKPFASERKGDEPFGTGLGLTSANYFIRQYGGSIDIESEVGKGTAVRIRIPHQEKIKSGKPRVLIVDDSDETVDIIRRICHQIGMETYGTTNGGKALELYRKLNPALVISDLCMPGLTGSEMMEQIRNINPDQRVVYISGYSENPEFQKWLKKEMRNPSLSCLVRKPFQVEKFRDVIKRMVYA